MNATNYLRELSKQKITNERCDISGRPAECFHHLNSFIEDARDVAIKLGLYGKEDLDNEDKRLLKEEFLKKNNKFKTVPLTRDIHNFFHYVFGKQSFNENNYNLFKDNLIECNEEYEVYWFQTLCKIDE